MVNFDIDITIVILFLVMNLVMGLYYSAGKKTLREYAVGDKSFSTSTLTATIIATSIGGGFFSGAITESYKQGLYFIIPALGEPLALIVLGYFLIPRMGEFLGDLSVADALGNLYGKQVRVISALSGVFLCIGIIALQFKVGAGILGLFFGISGEYATLLCAIIVTIYSAFGGIKAVTFTDVIQFFTFGTIIPIISLSIWGALNDPYAVFATLTENPNFSYQEVFNFSNPKFLSTLFLLLFFLVPDFQPVLFQRVIMAKDIFQGRKAFVLGGLICLVTLLVISWVGILLLSDNPTLDPNNLLPHIISAYSYPGLKGLTAVGVMAVIMSSADSYINSAAVLFTNDVLKPLNITKVKIFSDLTLASIFSFVAGIIGFFIAIKLSTVLDLLLFVFSFYAPIVSAPLLMTILGFRSTKLSVLIGIAAGSITVLASHIYNLDDNIITDLSMGMNIAFLIGSHYLLKQPGGWVGIRAPEPLLLIRNERKRKFYNCIHSIKNFNLIKFCRNNAPTEEYIYSLFGLFCIISVFSSMYSMPKVTQQQNTQIIEFLYHSVLLYSSIFLTYPIWPAPFRSERIIVIAWNIAVPYILLLAPMLLVIISNFGQFQLMVLMVNIIIIGTLLRWQVVVPMMVLCAIFAVNFYKWFVGVEDLTFNLLSLQFKMVYLLLLISSALIAFLKPKQQYQELSEVIKNHLQADNKQKQFELLKLSQYRQEFINRLYKQSIGTFRSVYHQINNLDQALQHENAEIANSPALREEKQKMVEIVDKLKAGAEYLDKVVLQIQDLIQINPVNVKLQEFISGTISKYRQVRGYYDLNILTQFRTEIEEIEIDPKLVEKVMVICFDHGISHSKTDTILLIFEDSEVYYETNEEETLKIRREGIKTSIIINNASINAEELATLLNPKFDTINEVNFAEIQKIVTAHCGKFYATVNDSGQLIYSIVLPKRLRDIRPKKMNLPDKHLEEIVSLDKLIAYSVDDALRNVACELLKTGMDSISVAKITKLPLNEVQKLKEDYG